MIFFESLLLFFFGMAIFLIVFMSTYLFIRKMWRKDYAKWDNMVDLLLRKAIFFHEENPTSSQVIPLTNRLKESLKNTRFRNQLVKKLMAAKRNMSGQYGENLRLLYLQLGLDQNALRLLDSKKWHLRAYAIQQIGTMELKEHLTKVYRYTNNKNELVRIEAQIAVLNLFGFEGLRFLDIISYQISEWQQIRLLKELSAVPQGQLSGIDKWLTSPNSSVVIFALKLARTYHRFELYDHIIACLDHIDPNVRKQAISTLTEIFTETTSKELLKRFPPETYTNQMAIMKAVKTIGDESDLPLLFNYLNAPEVELKLAIARAIVKLSHSGFSRLIADPRAQSYPLVAMIPQLKQEINP